jgi:biopolymer transport protein ExbD
MNFLRAERRDDAEINLIPMIDVLLVIVIFLAVTTTYNRFAELQINLPEAKGGAAEEKPAQVEVAVDAAGRYTVNSRSMPGADAQALGRAMQEAAAGQKEPMVVISADGRASHQSVVTVMEAARLTGMSHITFTTQTGKE